MEGVERPSAERGIHPRTSQACQRCRSLKTRCLPSEQPGTCQRCFSSKRECAWAEMPRRAKRVRVPSRISQVEQKIDGLVASLVNTDSTRPTGASRPTEATPNSTAASLQQALPSLRPLAPGSWFPVPASFEHQSSRTDQDSETSQRFLEKLRAIHNFGDEDADLSRPPGTLFNAMSRNEPLVECDIVQKLLSDGEAETLLNEYRSMSVSCPFVPIPTDISAQHLSAAKPMLCLAILTVASWKDHSRQMSLDQRYRQELANRTIIRPRRTLSLIQSIIVYLSWYHFVFSHKTQQIFSLLQLAIGLALDLGLHERSKRALEVPGRPKPKAHSPEEQRERQRTFLGCYYLSSAVSVSLMKPNLLKYNDYMAESGRRLRHEREYMSDEFIAPLVALRRIDDQINDTFNTDEAIDLPITDSRIAMNLRFIETQLEEWRRENNTGRENRALDLAYSFTDMQLHAISLRKNHLDAQLQTSNTTQLNALLSTLEAGKCFFDSLLAFPVSDYNLISFSEWMRLPHAVITMSRLCIPSEFHTAAQWDAKTAQDRVRLDLYLESLCYRMQGLSTFDKDKQPHPDFWWAIRMIMDLTRAWYCRRIRGVKAPSSQATPHDLPTPDTMRTSNHSGVEGSGSSTTPFVEGMADLHFSSMGAMDMNGGASTNAFGDGNDPFAFMREMDFDMDQFLDMGIWGSDSYEGMGFGGGNK